jgi:hypothetical protein
MPNIALSGDVGELASGGQRPRDRPREHDAEHDEHGGDDQQRIDDEVAEPPRRLAAAGGQRRREGRDEGGRHGSFGEQVAEQVGYAERDVEGVHLGAAARPENCRHDRLPRHAEDPARHRGDADETSRSSDARAHPAIEGRRKIGVMDGGTNAVGRGVRGGA